MNIKYKSNGNNDGDGNVFWTTMSDLMLGLAIIFITMFVLAMTGFTQDSVKQQQAQVEVSKQLEQAMQQAKIDVEVDEMTGNLKISDVELFELNSYVLTPKGKKLLDKLIPIYVKTIFSNNDISSQIENVVIQGHTDSHTFAGVNTKEDQFIKNMELSLKRANAVAEYMLKTKMDKQYIDKFRKIVVVEGKSYNEPVLVNGVEDYNKSRRVELRLKVKDWNVSKALGLVK